MQCLKKLGLKFYTFGCDVDDSDLFTSIAHAAGQVPNLERFRIIHRLEMKGIEFVEQYGKLYPTKKLILEEHQ
jgi:hypothetical protein